MGKMGKRGPKPRPVETLKLIGSNEQYRRKGEVSIVEGEPVKPEQLGPEGSAMWDRRVATLRNQGILSEAWQETLTVVCVAWQDFHNIWRAGGSGKELQAAIATFWKCQADFGLTPAAKTGIRTEPKPGGKDKQRFVKGTG